MSQPEQDTVTPAQREALQKAYSMLGEQFDSILIVVDFETEDDGDRVNAHECTWKGGALTAVGLAEYAKDRILRSGRREEP